MDDAIEYDPDAIYPEKGWVYLEPNTNWTKDGARFAIHLCNGSKSSVWYSMSKIEGTSYYGVKLPDDFSVANYKNIIFCRMNGSTSSNDWSNKWNQSGDLDSKKICAEGYNCCAIDPGQWDCGTNVSWLTLTQLN